MALSEYYRDYTLVWEPDPEEQSRLRRFLGGGMLLVLLLGIVLPLIHLAKETAAQEEVPERLARLRRLLILGDKGDPVAPEAACKHFAQGVRDSVVRMVYNEGRHHAIGKDALQKYAAPLLQNRPVPTITY